MRLSFNVRPQSTGNNVIFRVFNEEMIEAQQPTKSWAARLISGDIGLAKTFWIFSFAIPVAWNYLALSALLAIDFKHAFLVTTLPLMVWVPICILAIWRSGVAGPKRTVWGVLALLWMALVSIKLLALVSGAIRISLSS
ncbi:hypothetical protein [Paucibacter soli]|uniref:hypothetical protein n=1 Tax=Paucibacter soli TaxID=3133433 RepID=UPI00309B909A